MTLLVFDIKLPSVPPERLPAALLELWPSFMGYFISFVLLGIYWLGHRTQFEFIRHADQNLHWINIAFFACSAFIPFSTGLVSHYPRNWLALSIYSLNLIVIGMALYWHWAYAVKHTRLVDDNIPRGIIRYGKQRSLLAPCCYVIAIAMSFITPYLSLAVFILVPILYIVPSIRAFWLRRLLKD